MVVVEPFPLVPPTWMKFAWSALGASMRRKVLVFEREAESCRGLGFWMGVWRFVRERRDW